MPDARPSPSPVLSTVFIVWCFIVGTLLLYAPWMPIWLRWTAPFTAPLVREVLMHPTFRGAVSGFGLLHLLWGTHDLDLLISRLLRARQR